MLDDLTKKYYNIWLNHPRVNATMKAELANMEDDEITSIFQTEPLKFGTAGVRMQMGPGFQRLNSFTYQMLTEGLSKFLLEKFDKEKKITVVIGHDNRQNSSHFALICARVLSSFGIKALLFENNELMPTPIISYTVLAYKAHAGINITASHNPKIYNGFKIYGNNGAQILDKEANTIISYCSNFNEILDKVYQLDKSNIAYISRDNINDYFIAAKSALINTYPNVSKNYPIVFTGHHGTSVKKFPRFLRMLGYQNIIDVKEQNEYDSNFTYSDVVNPEDPSSFNLAIKYAEKNNAKIIIANDPDADRMAVAIKRDDEWRFLTGNEMGIIYSYYVLKNKKFNLQPYIVSSYVSTNLVDRIAKKYNALVHRTPTGFKYMGNYISDKIGVNDLVVAFEEAIGALNSSINRDKDGFQAGALALEIYTTLIKENKDFVDYLNQIYSEFGYWQGKTSSFIIKSDNWRKKVDDILKKLLDFNEKEVLNRKITYIGFNEEGGCVDWILEEDSWIRFRKSGTEPKFKIYYNLYGKSISSLDSEINSWNAWFKNFLNL
ncbi:MAG: phospho-sugar mutase [Mycoplasmataceae bacterium]|nr:phospho-sugar mutase [Mycoplasmataceae bacterium]